MTVHLREQWRMAAAFEDGDEVALFYQREKQLETIVAGDYGPLSWERAYELAHKVLTEGGVSFKRLKVSENEADDDAAATIRLTRAGTVYLYFRSPRYMTRWNVIHECAHLIAGEDQGHGPRFQEVLAGLIVRYYPGRRLVASKDWTVEKRTWVDPMQWPEGYPADRKFSDESIVYTAKRNGQTLGYMRLRQRDIDGVWFVWRIETYDQHQRRGVATSLIEQARADLGEIAHSPESERTPDGLAWSRAVGSKTAAGKPFAEMDESEFRSKKWVYHGTRDAGDLQTLLNQGVRMANVPRNLARMRYEKGEYAEFAPGAGAGHGLYVGNFYEAQQYGNKVVAIEVHPGDLSLPPESEGWSIEEALNHANGALISKDIPASRVHLVADGFKTHSNDPLAMAQAVEKAKHAPKEDLTEMCPCGHNRGDHWEDSRHPSGRGACKICTSWSGRPQCDVFGEQPVLVQR